MQAGPTTYDIIVPTNNFIPTYMKLDLIEPLRQDLIPNLTNLDREFVDTDYDPGNRYTVPYQWGTTGIGFNRQRAGEDVNSWSAVFEPPAAMGGHVTLLREVTDLIGCALIYLGRSPNSIKDSDLADVVKLVRSIKPRLKGFTTDTYIDELAANETWLAQGWSGDVFQAQDQNQDVSYTIPKEGSLRFVDVMAVPKGAPHPVNAARFMNYVLHPKVQARISRVRELRHAGVAGQAAAAGGADVRPVDLPAGLDQAVDRHPDRPEAPEVAGGLRRDRQVAFPV